MTTSARARNWMMYETHTIPLKRELTFRQLTAEDSECLGALMHLAYSGAIDSEGESREQCIEEMKGTLTGKYGPFMEATSYGVFPL